MPPRTKMTPEQVKEALDADGRQVVNPPMKVETVASRRRRVTAEMERRAAKEPDA